MCVSCALFFQYINNKCPVLSSGTLCAACELMKKQKAQVLGCLVVIELKDLRGAEKLPVPVFSLLQCWSLSHLHRDEWSIPHLHGAISTRASDSFWNRILSLKKVGASLSNYQLIATNESCSVGLFVLGMQLCNCTWFLVNTSVFLCNYSPDPGFIHMHIVHSVAWLGQVYKCAIIWWVSKGWNHAWSGSILLSVKAILRTSCMTSSFIINNKIFLG